MLWRPGWMPVPDPWRAGRAGWERFPVGRRFVCADDGRWNGCWEVVEPGWARRVAASNAAVPAAPAEAQQP